MVGKKILVATDGSAGADRAVDLAATLSRALDATLVILSVQEAPPGEVVEAYTSIERVAEAEIGEFTARAALGRAQLRAQKAGANAVRTRAETGDPTQRILEVAKNENADLIVVGKRGRGPIAALLLGSVSQKLVSLASCPVLVVP